MPVTFLSEAANVCLSTMQVRFLAHTLKTDLQAFCNAIGTGANDQFSDANPVFRRCGNWLILIQGVANGMTPNGPPTNNDLDTFELAVETVYRFLWQCEDQFNFGNISAAQYNAVKAAFNANLD